MPSPIDPTMLGLTHMPMTVRCPSGSRIQLQQAGPPAKTN
jgi:hypothetical protein